jgi:hypothetical protein
LRWRKTNGMLNSSSRDRTLSKLSMIRASNSLSSVPSDLRILLDQMWRVLWMLLNKRDMSMWEWLVVTTLRRLRELPIRLVSWVMLTSRTRTV